MGNITKKIKLNSEQEAALDISKSLAIRAGAGSGKTRVLTERYLKLLREVDVCIENIVAITFTKKAALEMKQRIREGIAWEIENEINQVKKDKWKKIRDTITNSNINTIHSFCEKIIKENFWYLGIDPDFKILDEADVETNLKEIVKEEVNIYFSEASNIGVAEYFKIYGTKKIINESIIRDIIEVYSKICEKGLGFDEIKENISFENKKNFLNEIDYDEETIKEIIAVENLILNIIISVHQKYERFKNQEKGLDFNDLEILTLKVLENSDISEFYKNKCKFFLIDEFQDVNPIQKKILYHFICNKEDEIEHQKLFVVGDHKQSIYGFRGTDYSIFNEICDKLKPNVKYLSTCYRSTPEIIYTVNKIFTVLLDPYEELKPKENFKFENKKVELIKLQKEENSEQSDDTWKVISKLIGSDDESQELEDLLNSLKDRGAIKGKKDKYAEALAVRINELIKEGFEYKDVAVLIRSKTNIGSIENALKDLDIPYCIMGGIGFWDRQEVVDIINLYKLIVNSNDMILLIGALRSPLFGFSDNLILELAKFLNSKNAFKALEELKNSNIQESEQVQRAIDILTKLKGLEGIMSAYELLKDIIKTTNYKQILLTQINGYRRIRNIEKLMQIAKDFDTKNLYNTREFTTYIDALKNSSSSESEAVLDTENSNAVKILTIHMSKGLQFKAVIIPDIHTDIFKMSKINKPQFMLDEQFGITASYITGEGKDRFEQNPLFENLYDNKLQREFEDSKRVLYVAMTRAEKFLCLIGEDQEYKDEKSLSSYMKQIKYAINSNNNSTKYLSIKDINQYHNTTDNKSYSFDKIDDSINKFTDSKSEGTNINNLLWKYDGQASKMFSISQYMQYLDCPRGYYYRYVSRINENMIDFEDIYQVGGVEFILDEVEKEYLKDEIPANTRGSIVHKIFEEAVLRKIKDENELLALGKEIAVNWLGKEQFDITEFSYEVEKYIKNYLNIEKSFKKEVSGIKIKTFVELPFRIPISDDKRILINGVIDRVDVYETEDSIDLYIVDYKTNVIQTKEEVEYFIEYYIPQLMIYYNAALVLIKDKNKPVRIQGVYLYFADNGEYKKVEVSNDDVKKFLKVLNKTVIEISERSNLDEYQCNVSDKCNKCEYIELCK